MKPILSPGILTVVLALAGGPPSALGQGLQKTPTAPQVARPTVAQRLLYGPREELPTTGDRLYDAFALVEPESLPEVLSVLRGKRRGDPRMPRSLDDQRRAQLLQMFTSQLPRARKALSTLSQDTEKTRPERMVAIRLLGFLGRGADFPLLVAQLQDDASDPSEYIATAVVDGLVDLFEREPVICGLVPGAFDRASAFQRQALLRVLGTCRCKEATQTLAALLGRVAALDATLLSYLSRSLVANPGASLDPETTAPIRQRLMASLPEVRREAALVLGRLADVSSVPELLRRLTDDHEGAREAAHWALKSITGLRLSLDAERWQRWHEGELAWWQSRGEDLVAALESAPRPQTLAGIREAAARRLFRHQIAERLVDLLSSDDREVVVAAAGALGSMGTRIALQPLIQLLDHDEDSIQSAAWLALKAITGLALGRNSAEWRESLS
ncbi:MAG: HEAT repeat domain-containing protein [Planctomycetes bacterium]|nr:HEAT repeat domain-containing protein [Planctomycetota bacterium]